ncbi:hypothetical protein [Thiomonas sp. FB-6]|uniref:hypothetical protein n=1 Tax=Thiomonas sp. FB-6 TaxID=1158291 RepID=UPI0012DE1F4A|nr:hypothetical protein [Thiomonas sp. FB-6]
MEQNSNGGEAQWGPGIIAASSIGDVAARLRSNGAHTELPDLRKLQRQKYSTLTGVFDTLLSYLARL